VGISFVRSIMTRLLRVVFLGLWILLGLWTALAVLFTVPINFWAAAVLALVIAGVYAFAFRERLFARGQPGLRQRGLRLTLLSLASTAIVLVWYFGFVRPNPDEKWSRIHARMPHVEIKGDKIHVTDVRNFTWRTATDFTPAYYDRVYDLNALNSMYYVLSPILDLNGVAHVWVCFGFSDGQTVAISVEARGVDERPYSLLGSMFRQFQLIYVVGDERDIVGLRGGIWKNEVRFYPVNATDERKRALFVDMMQRAHSLEENPEFYNLFFNNCMNNITYHVRRLGGRSVPSDLALLLTGFSDRAAYEFGFIDTNGLSFEQARKAYRVDQWMETTQLDDTFPRRLREQIEKQVAQAKAASK
jgi:hypothetical protein